MTTVFTRETTAPGASNQGAPLTNAQLDANFINLNNDKAPLDGTGATGNWGISVTGNAATATKLATPRTINGVNFDGSANISVPVGWSDVTGKPAVIAAGADKAAARSEIDAASTAEVVAVDNFSGGYFMVDIVAKWATQLPTLGSLVPTLNGGPTILVENGWQAVTANYVAGAHNSGDVFELVDGVWVKKYPMLPGTRRTIFNARGVRLTGAPPTRLNLAHLDEVVVQMNTEGVVSFTTPLNKQVYANPLFYTRDSNGYISTLGDALGYLDSLTTNNKTQLVSAINELNGDKLSDAPSDGKTYGRKDAAWIEAAPLASPSFTGTVSGVTKAMVGLGNVDNTSDANKPVSTATQTALDLKANLASPTFTGTPAAPTAAVGTNTTQIATTAHVFAERAATATLTNKTLASPVSTGGIYDNGSVRSNIVAVAALNIDCSLGNYFTKTISGASTFTFSNAPASLAYAFTLEVSHVSGALTWPVSVVWPGNTAPTLTAGRTHLFTFVTDDGGARWRGVANADYPN